MSLTREQVITRANTKLKDLHPVVAADALRVVARAFDGGVPVIVTQGRRTIAYQNALYAQGRNGHPGQIVTNAPGGHSFHNYDLAWDFSLEKADGTQLDYNIWRDADHDGQRDWMEVVKIAKEEGFEWGGEFKTIVDMPHFQMCFGLTIKDLLAGKRPPIQAKQPEVLPVNIFVNGKQLEDGSMRKGTTYVKLRPVAETLGGLIGWNTSSRTATLNDVLIPGEILEGVMWVPLRKVTDILKVDIEWDTITRTARMLTHK